MSPELNAIKIRKATLNDSSAVIACARKAYARYVDIIGKEPAPMVADFASQISDGYVHIAEQQHQLMGYVVFYPAQGSSVHLENVAVLPEAAGCGIGKQLVRFVESWAIQQDLQVVQLYTNEAMTENLAIYPRLGYVEIDRKQQDGFNRVYYKKELC